MKVNGNIHCDYFPCTTSKMTKVEKHHWQLWMNSFLCVSSVPLLAPSSLSNAEWIALVQEIAAKRGRQLQTCSTQREGGRQTYREGLNRRTWPPGWIRDWTIKNQFTVKKCCLLIRTTCRPQGLFCWRAFFLLNQIVSYSYCCPLPNYPIVFSSSAYKPT